VQPRHRRPSARRGRRAGRPHPERGGCRRERRSEQGHENGTEALRLRAPFLGSMRACSMQRRFSWRLRSTSTAFRPVRYVFWTSPWRFSKDDSRRALSSRGPWTGSGWRAEKPFAKPWCELGCRKVPSRKRRSASGTERMAKRLRRGGGLAPCPPARRRAASLNLRRRARRGVRGGTAGELPSPSAIREARGHRADRCHP
jgi:hypothetical protein